MDAFDSGKTKKADRLDKKGDKKLNKAREIRIKNRVAMSPNKVFTGDKKKKDKKVDQGSFEPAFPGGDHSLADLKKMKTKEIMDYYSMDKKQVKNILKGKIK